jgi:hypothetical protein
MDLQSRTSLAKASALFLLIAIFSTRTVSAMEIAMYDQMAIQDQKEYLKYLVRTTEQVLTEEGRPDLAKQVALLFKAPGNQVSAGEALFQEGLKFDRNYRVEHPDLPFPLSAEASLIYVLTKSDMSKSLPNAFTHRLAALRREKPFWAKRPLRTH